MADWVAVWMGGAVLVLGFLLVGLLGPFDPDAPCVFGDFVASDIVSVVVFLGWGCVDRGVYWDWGILALGSKWSLSPWDFLISSFAHFTGLLCDGSILFGVEGYGAYFVFWEALYHFRDHFFPFLWIQRLILGTIYTIFAFKRAIQISVRLKDVQVPRSNIHVYIASRGT